MRLVYKGYAEFVIAKKGFNFVGLHDIIIIIVLNHIICRRRTAEWSIFMTLITVKNLLDAKVLTGETDARLENISIHSACGSDLMSDVLAFVKDQGLLLTGLVNPQVIRTAEMMDIVAICFVRSKAPDESVITLAKQRGIPIMTTKFPLFIACGKLYSGGLTCGEV